MISDGSGGVFLKTPTSWPLGRIRVSPASFTRTPEIGSSAKKYSTSGDLNGFVSCPARYANPFRLCSSSGLCTSTSPIFEASGHVGAAVVKGWRSIVDSSPDSGVSPSEPSKPIAPTEHVSSPSAAPALACRPSGKVSSVSFTSASATPLADRVGSWGILTSTVRPVGVLAVFWSGLTLSDGVNGSELQPTSGACS